MCFCGVPVVKSISRDSFLIRFYDIVSTENQEDFLAREIGMPVVFYQERDCLSCTYFPRFYICGELINLTLGHIQPFFLNNLSRDFAILVKSAGAH